MMAGFSSRGPTAFDYEAKPDLVAPGVGTVSLSDPGSLMYLTKPTALLRGPCSPATKPYLSLSGTSMASPVVAGTRRADASGESRADAEPGEGDSRYTAQVYPGYDALTQGAGFLNTKGAVDLARFFTTAHAGQTYPHPAEWSKKINWGNHRIAHGVIKPNATAWKSGVVWGAAKTATGENIVWGTAADDCDNVVWGTHGRRRQHRLGHGLG